MPFKLMVQLATLVSPKESSQQGNRDSSQRFLSYRVPGAMSRLPSTLQRRPDPSRRVTLKRMTKFLKHNARLKVNDPFQALHLASLTDSFDRNLQKQHTHQSILFLVVCVFSSLCLSYHSSTQSLCMEHVRSKICIWCSIDLCFLTDQQFH